ncbi:MAG: filamentous hemagglutinin family protein [Sphingomonadaceae bacterium]|nr:filamentous hemagglutinin family protein [Sphingomonadaceae bacterium]
MTRSGVVRAALLGGTVLAGGLGSLPAFAQSAAAFRAAAGLPAAGTAEAAAGGAGGQPATTGIDPLSLIRDQSSAAARALARTQQMVNAVSIAQQAQAAAAQAARAAASPVPNGLAAGGLVPAVTASALTPIAQDLTGVRTWQGALFPTQSQANGQTTVTITQTDPRAVLSWTSFNVGRDTTVQFDQKLNGVAQADWIALNRVVGRIDPATGRRDPSTAPAASIIAGQIKSDGTVLVINPDGVIFTGSAQINARSLIASALDVGRAQAIVSGRQSLLTIQQRNDEFQRQGLLGIADVLGQTQGQPFTFSGQYIAANTLEPTLEGAIRVQQGARLASGDTGFVMLIAPTVTNAGALSSADGQVSLLSSRQVQLTRATGTGTGPLSLIRGLVASASGGLDNGYVQNTGIISAPRGYVSLGAGATGAVLQDGLLLSTTSVSRNGYIDLFAGDVRLAPNSVIAVTPDTNGETIPQSPESVATFNPSQVRIGGASPAQTDAAARIELAQSSTIYAPGGSVTIGLPTTIESFDTANGFGANASRVFIDTGAVIDVGGVKDLELPASRNTVTIGPLKRNELRDTPLYRDTGSFLNGATVTVDPRVSGVRADGVRWVGSPLIEAESFFQQVGVTAAELLTKGGTVQLGAAYFSEFAGTARRDPALASDVIVKPGATIDISGGWVRYAAGTVSTSQLVTANGQLVDISQADPNVQYVGLITPVNNTITRFGVTESFTNAQLQGARPVASFTEGRDAGALAVSASAAAIGGTIYADAFAGSVQRSNAQQGTATGRLAADLRNLQANPQQLPASGLLWIKALSNSTPDITPGVGGGNALIAASVAQLATGLGFGQSVSLDSSGNLVRVGTRPTSALLDPALRDTFQFSSVALTDMGLGQFSLWTSGAIRVDPSAQLRLMPGGVLDLNAGRRIDFAGAAAVGGGRIDLATFNIAVGQTFDGTDRGGGSVFVSDPAAPGSFDVRVTGELAARGRFVNDLGLKADAAEGGAYQDGGAIRIESAPRLLTSAGNPAGSFTDISGSILIEAGALLDVSSGVYVDPSGTVSAAARGGDVSLVNQTNFLQTFNDYDSIASQASIRRLRFTLPSTVFLPTIPENPTAITSTVRIQPGTIASYGFAGGGAFTLVTPQFAFGPAGQGQGTQLPIGFIGGTGFASYDVRVFQTALFANRFVNNLGGTNAVQQTAQVTVGAGQTLNLTQTQFFPILSSAEVAGLQAAPTGSDIRSVLTPRVPVAGFDQRPVSFSLGGFSELIVAPGASVTGAAGAALNVQGLLNQGTIRLPGGTIAQAQQLFPLFETIDPQAAPIAIRQLSDVFATRADGSIVEGDPNALGLRDATGRVLTNAEVAFQRPLFIAGQLTPGTGVRLASGSVTDLSGISLLNPRATTPGGAPVADGRLVPGGTLSSASRLFASGTLFTEPQFGSSIISGVNNVPATTAARSVVLDLGARLSLSGASDRYARLTASGAYQLTPQWSDAGSLVLGGGGRITPGIIDARGGAPQAQGGTLDSLNPILRASAGTGSQDNVIAADQLTQAGFDAVFARGSLTGDGAVTLTLGRSFQLTNAPSDNQNFAAANFVARVGGTGPLTVNAPLIRFASIAQTVPNIALGTPGQGSATFAAQALDLKGAVLFDRSLANVRLQAAGDVRLLGTQQLEANFANPGIAVLPSLIGQTQAAGNLTLAAAQVYPTTGSTYAVASSGPAAIIRIERTTQATPDAPYAAGANLSIQAAAIEQAGVLRAPLSTLTLGGNAPLSIGGQVVAPATTRVTLLAGSVTSVSANGLRIPYGTTQDQVQYFFTPTTSSPLTAAPAATLNIAGSAIDLRQAATVDLTGGGEVYAYEFIPGVGGSRDVLSRLNSDQFSGNGGFQFADGRQVYAIVPGLSTKALAAFDPIYSADYAALYGPNVGRSVALSGVNGLPDGSYTLLPARYALLPGGVRIVEQPEYGEGVAGLARTLPDGTQVVGGYYAIQGTNIRESVVRSFSVQTQDVFRRFSNIATTDATTASAALADRNAQTPPRATIDAGRLVLQPILSLAAQSSFLTSPASGGRASSTDIAGQAFLLFGSAPPATAPANTILVSTTTLNTLNSASLLIGGTRTDNADGTTSLSITGRSITVANSGGAALTAPELLLAVDGAGSSITVADGSVLTATGTIADPRTGNYLIAGGSGGQSGVGALLRLSAGAARSVTRTNVTASGAAPMLSIGLAQLTGNSLLADSTGGLSIATPAGGGAPAISASNVALGAAAIAFADQPVAGSLTINGTLAGRLTGANLTLRSASPIQFRPGTLAFGALTLDTPGFASSSTMGAVAITAGATRLLNSSGVTVGGCATTCGTQTLAITATTLSFGSGAIDSNAFGGGTTLSASSGVRYDGVGSLNAGTGQLTINAPFIADASPATPLGTEPPLPSLALASSGAVSFSAAGATVSAAVPTGLPGANLSISGQTISVTDTRLRATAGRLALQAAQGITATGSAAIEAPAFARTFGDADDPVMVAAPGGLVRLASTAGAIMLGQKTALTVGGAQGNAGAIEIETPGAVTLGGALNASAPGGGGSFSVKSGGSLDLGALAPRLAAFNGLVQLTTGAGDLALGAGQTLAAQQIGLSALGGTVSVAGTINTGGIVGGAIELYGTSGVTLAGSGRLIATASGYGADDSRQARGGNVTIGTDRGGTITLAEGSLIDVRALRPGDRLVTDIRNSQTFYRLAQGDLGGTLTVRAPAGGSTGAVTVPVSARGTVSGAREVSLEAVRRYDLAAAAADAALTGVTVAGNTATVNVAQTAAGRANLFADTAPNTIPGFVQGFQLATGQELGGLTASPNFVARPGVELSYGGNIALTSNWNLGAGTVDTARALADGVIQPRIGGGLSVPFGNEGALLANYTTFVYRVGGRADGAAPAISMRAGGAVRIGASISDGFFTFRDQTTPDALAYALGGGTRQYAAAILPVCPGFGDCGTLTNYVPGLASTRALSLSFGQANSFTPGGVVSIDQPIPVAYSAGANAASAAGNGDPTGSAEVFPILPNGRAVDSATLRITAGSAAGADPLATAAGTNAALTVTGQTSYTPSATVRSAQYGLPLRVVAGTDAELAPVVAAANFAQAFAASIRQAGPNTAVTLELQSAPTSVRSFLAQQAAAFFTPLGSQATLTGPTGAPTRVVTTLTLASQFLATIDSEYGTRASVASAYQPQTPFTPTIGSPQFIRTTVRTGNGDIALSASGNIDTTVPGAAGSGVFQGGSTAIYTSGQRANLAARTIAGISVNPASFVQTVNLQQSLGPSLQAAGLAAPTRNALVQTPLYLENGGDLSVRAGGSVLGRRDVAGSTRPIIGNQARYIGRGDTPFRVGQIGATTDIRTNPQLFQAGFGTLGGGDIAIRAAAGSLIDLTVVANTSVTTASVTGAGSQPTQALWTIGGGTVTLHAGNAIAGGLFDIGAGSLTAVAGGNVLSTGTVTVLNGTQPAVQQNFPRVRVTDATAALTARGTLTLRGIAGDGVTDSDTNYGSVEASRGFYTPAAGVDLRANGRVALTLEGADILSATTARSDSISTSFPVSNLQIAILPGSLRAASLTANLALAPLSDILDYQLFMVPGPLGQLELYAGNTLQRVAINMDDSDPGLLPGYFTVFDAPQQQAVRAGRPFIWPAVLPSTSDAARRQLHNARITHAGDPVAVRVLAGADIQSLILNLPKAGRLFAGRDITNAVFTGQNVRASDVTRVAAGRDIVGTSRVAPAGVGNSAQQLPVIDGNSFVVGGPGAFYLDAGRDAGPFLNSATTGQSRQSYGGGILSVGNEYNPWFGSQGATVGVNFGVAQGINYAGLRESYLNPANSAALPDELFAFSTDANGRFVFDRSRPIYAPLLLGYLQATYPDQLTAAFGTVNVTSDQAYRAFAALPLLNQREFLNQLFFNEMVQTSIPTSPSFGRPSRSYAAINVLFPPSRGYTQNNLGSGASGSANPVATGNLDLRLSTVQTSRGGSVTVLGPGGRVLGGSTVATSQQAARLGYIGQQLALGQRATRLSTGQPVNVETITAIPVGFEGFLTLRGGPISGFVDRDFLLNQSRLFTQGGGDITLFSANGDVNAGQGARTSANFPPVSVRISPNLFSEVDALSGVAGAGIAAFQPAPGIAAPNVFLIAPAGTVDAGDAGVRVAGNLFVAALSVANADNFQVGGQSFGVPAGAVVNVGANSAGAAQAAAAAAVARDVANNTTARRALDAISRILVQVLGFSGRTDPCDQNPRPANCPAPPR